MAALEPQHASDYDGRTTAAVKSVLVEIGQILGSFHGKFAVVGGMVPQLLLTEAEMPHVGTGDVDLTLDAESLGDGEYAQLVDSLRSHGYQQRRDLRRFQLIRTVKADDGGPDIDVVVDFLMPREANFLKSATPLVKDFAVQRADGADLALRFREVIQVEGNMPDGGTNRVRMVVASIPALLAMKGYALANRLKPKDAYDIYYCVRNYPGGLDALVAATSPLLGERTAKGGYDRISEKFRHPNDFGPNSVRRFVESSYLLGGRTAEQWQQDAFGQVRAWLSLLDLG